MPRFWMVLGLLAFLALGVRWVNILEWQPTIDDPDRSGPVVENGYYLGGDAVFYHRQAHAVRDGHGFVDPGTLYVDGVLEPSASAPPTYTVYLAGWTLVGMRTVTQHRLASGLLGVGTVVLIALLARRLAGDRAALIAAGLGAVYPGLWINDSQLLSETMSMFATAMFLVASYRVWRTPSPLNVVLAGLAAGFAVLTRSELSLLFPLAMVPMLLTAGDERDRQWRWQRVLLATAFAGMLVVPWLVRNLVSFEEPTLLKGQTGAVISAGACDEVFYGEKIGLYSNCFVSPIETRAERLTMDESERDIAPREYATEYIGDHLSRMPVVMAARVGRVWSVFKPFHTTRTIDIFIERRGEQASWIALWMYYAMIPFAALGLVTLRKRRIPVVVLVGVALTVSFAAAITFGNTRYRAPAEVPLVAVAAVGIDRVLRGRGAPTMEMPDMVETVHVEDTT
jgi:4-amino-4-deoxy-L-arabinose transferase-like glycosyltransferase